MQNIVLDKIDLKILQVLQENGRLTNVELSERVALSPSPCLRRLKQLEDAGISNFQVFDIHKSFAWNNRESVISYSHIDDIEDVILYPPSASPL